MSYIALHIIDKIYTHMGSEKTIFFLKWHESQSSCLSKGFNIMTS